VAPLEKPVNHQSTEVEPSTKRRNKAVPRSSKTKTKSKHDDGTRTTFTDKKKHTKRRKDQPWQISGGLLSPELGDRD
jgi:hypothetical protein